MTNNVTNSETERVAIEHVMTLERAAGRQPEDVHRTGRPYDISSPPRKIEVKAFGRSARGAQIPLEERQYMAAMEDPDFYLYVVDHVARTDGRRDATDDARPCHAARHLLAHIAHG